jgi:hypothetical protein
MPRTLANSFKTPTTLKQPMMEKVRNGVDGCEDFDRVGTKGKVCRVPSQRAAHP